jgi:DNA-binding CsgD family transcriptional regulator
VIQRLFASGLTLHSVAMAAQDGATKQRLLATVQDLDDTISQIRTTIFQLEQGPATGPAGVRTRLLAVLADVGPALGFDPGLRLSGVLEDRLATDLVDDLLAVLREALTHVARAAQPAGPLATLSEQERTVLGLIGEGLTNRQIGERMFLAEKTVKNHVSRLLAKLGLERRTQAAVLATELRSGGAPDR